MYNPQCAQTLVQEQIPFTDKEIVDELIAFLHNFEFPPVESEEAKQIMDDMRDSFNRLEQIVIQKRAWL